MTNDHPLHVERQNKEVSSSDEKHPEIKQDLRFGSLKLNFELNNSNRSQRATHCVPFPILKVHKLIVSRNVKHSAYLQIQFLYFWLGQQTKKKLDRKYCQRQIHLILKAKPVPFHNIFVLRLMTKVFFSDNHSQLK